MSKANIPYDARFFRWKVTTVVETDRKSSSQFRWKLLLFAILAVVTGLGAKVALVERELMGGRLPERGLRSLQGNYHAGSSHSPIEPRDFPR